MTRPTHWAAAARPGDIAMFRFPLSESGASGKARPCLIIAVEACSSGLRLTLAYGTSSPTDANRGWDLAIGDPHEAAQAGLRRPTRFVLGRRITVAGDDPRFDCGGNGTALVGSLPPPHQAAMRGLILQLGGFLARHSHGDRARVALPLHARRTISRRTRSGRIAETVVIETRRRSLRTFPSAAVRRTGRAGEPSLPPGRRARLIRMEQTCRSP